MKESNGWIVCLMESCILTMVGVTMMTGLFEMDPMVGAGMAIVGLVFMTAAIVMYWNSYMDEVQDMLDELTGRD